MEKEEITVVNNSTTEEHKNKDKHPKKKVKPSKSKWKKGARFSLHTIKFLGKVIILFFLILFFTISLFIIGIYHKYSEDFKDATPKSGGTQAIFYDKNGDIIYEGYGTSDSEYSNLEEMPDIVKNTTLAAEDINFYSHGPIDPVGISRAAYNNWQNSEREGLTKIFSLFDEKEYSEGGSTITQQLVKNRYLESERSFERKIKEIVYSYEMEKKYSKDEILELYLNNIYYGEQSLGIKNAAKTYFDKEVGELNLAEASMLAGLPQAPSKYSPISGNYEESKRRQEYVLQQMIGAGFITTDNGRETINEPLPISGIKEKSLKYPFFVQYIKQELISLYGSDMVEAGGLKVYTTLDPKKQEIAENTAKKYVDKLKYKNVSNASVVVMDNKTNNILAMVGGIDWNKDKVNLATSPRQPGSSFKPIVYATGFKEGYTPLTKLLDSYINFGGNPPYIPKNYSGGYWGNVSVRTALANSLNIPAVEMTQLAGVENVISTAHSLGISTIDGNESNYGLSIGLGSAEVKLLDMVGVYSTFSAGGERTTFSGIDRVLNNQGGDIYKVNRQRKEVIDPKIAYMISDILSDTKERKRAFGYRNKLEVENHTIAAKTGTTDNYSDSWTIGYTPDITVGVWMGNNDRENMNSLSGIDGAANIWNEIFEIYLKNTPDKKFKKPKDISEIWVNQYTYSKATYEGVPYKVEYFIPGTEPETREDFSYLDIFTKNRYR